MDISILRHSAAHIMAAAVKRLYKNVKLGIGPAIQDGFYYDFDINERIRDTDLKKIEEEMKKIVKEKHEFIKFTATKKEAKDLLKDEPYKLELLEELPDDEVSFYKCGEFLDMCKGPHVESTSAVKVFKLLKVAGAYWRGNENNKMLQRIYGTAFFDKKSLKDYLHRIASAKKRDHRKLGTELSLFSVQEKVGGGLVHWHPDGAMIRELIERIWKKSHLKSGYKLVYTPHIASEEIFKISGHLENFSDMMYSAMEIEGRPFRIKPMNCPFHIMIYKSALHSYRELPLRYAELGTVYRFEKSGVLHGLLRVRGFTQDDAHIFCTHEQLEEEVKKVFKFSVEFLKLFGFEEFEIYIATRPAKAIGTDEMWKKAEESLKNALKDMGMEFTIDEGGGAFYGPKIDLKLKDSLSRPWQCTTIQFDFNLPERFDMVYVNNKGEHVRPYMVHRALLGSLERFFGVLIENYAGAFPVWLAPVQVKILPVTDENLEYAKKVLDKLLDNDIRAELDGRFEKLGFKIREATKKKIPFMIILGENEEKNNTITVRCRSGENIKDIKIAEFIKMIKQEEPEPIVIR